MRTLLPLLLISGAVSVFSEVKPEADAATGFSYVLVKSTGKLDVSSESISKISGPATIQQLDTIKSLMADTSLGTEWATGYLKAKKCSKFGEMTYTQAGELIVKLEKYKSDMDGYRKRNPQVKTEPASDEGCANGQCSTTTRRWGRR